MRRVRSGLKIRGCAEGSVVCLYCRQLTAQQQPFLNLEYGHPELA
jgi:hypothetical protein